MRFSFYGKNIKMGFPKFVSKYGFGGKKCSLAWLAAGFGTL